MTEASVLRKGCFLLHTFWILLEIRSIRLTSNRGFDRCVQLSVQKLVPFHARGRREPLVVRDIRSTVFEAADSLRQVGLQ
jgi:hypothetical protein